MLELAKTTGLFIITALAEIAGCYWPYLWLKQGRSAWLLAPAALALAAFVWLLTLHPQAAARTYAAYGGVYVAVAIAWLLWVEGVIPTRWDLFGAVVTITGMAIIALQPRPA
jgi:small multidrug resistance family-3 protein